MIMREAQMLTRRVHKMNLRSASEGGIIAGNHRALVSSESVRISAANVDSLESGISGSSHTGYVSDDQPMNPTQRSSSWR